jgi:hypothetical protein
VPQALEGIKTSEIGWLHGQQGQGQGQPMRGGQRSQHEARRRWLARWVWWLLAELALPLLRACFYCTESEPYRQQVFFYRCAHGPPAHQHQHWHKHKHRHRHQRQHQTPPGSLMACKGRRRCAALTGAATCDPT